MKRCFLNRYETAVILAIVKFVLREYGLDGLSKLSFSDIHKIQIVHDEHRPLLKVTIDFGQPPKLQYWENDELRSEDVFASENELSDFLSVASVEELIEEGFKETEDENGQ